MDKKIELLDCTLRDGAYIVDSHFGNAAISGIVKKLRNANIDIIECGWLKNTPHEEGSSFFHVPADLKPYLGQKDGRTLYAVMIDWDRYDLDYLPQNDGTSVDVIRVVFPHGKHKEGIEVGRKIKEKGYQVLFQAANTLAYSDEDLRDLAEEVNKVNPVSISVVDTFGAMYEKDLERIVRVMDRYLNPEIKMGFHSHNNQQLSFALSMYFAELGKRLNRATIIDASLCGMGRGAGNATTELVVSYLNREHHGNYDMDCVMDAIDMYMEYFKENYSWGYSTPYFIAGLYCSHVNNIAYLLKNHRTNARDMRNIISTLSPEERCKYDYDLLERTYLENQSKKVDDEAALEILRTSCAGKQVLLIAPGKTTVTQKERIQKFIAEKNPVVIGVNAVNENYKMDYLFLINSVRYEYAKDVHSKQFKAQKKILLSSIKTEAEEDELIVNFSRVVKRGWEYFDNAVIDCLRLMEKIQVESVAIAGFDGFKNRYNESYADSSLPTLNPDNNWDQLNREIADMFQDFKKTLGHNMEIELVTDSIFG